MNNSRILLFYWKIITKDVFKLNFSVTSKCNLKCNICNIWKCYNENKKEITLKDYDSFLTKMNRWNWISFTGGEPFLRKDLYDLIKLSIEKCRNLHTISIPTNGYSKNKILDDVKKILDIKDLASMYVTVSLDGFEYFHDEQRGLKGSFKNALKTFYCLRDLNDKRLKVFIEWTMSKFNQGMLESFLKSYNFTANDIILSIAQNSYFYNNSKVDYKANRDVLKNDIRYFLSKLRIKRANDIAQKVFLRCFLSNTKIPCIAGINSFHMDSFGKIYPCIIRKHKKNQCNCYTPCENYFSLLLNKGLTLSKLI